MVLRTTLDLGAALGDVRKNTDHAVINRLEHLTTQNLRQAQKSRCKKYTKSHCCLTTNFSIQSATKLTSTPSTPSDSSIMQKTCAHAALLTIEGTSSASMLWTLSEAIAYLRKSLRFEQRQASSQEKVNCMICDALNQVRRRLKHVHIRSTDNLVRIPRSVRTFKNIGRMSIDLLGLIVV